MTLAPTTTPAIEAPKVNAPRKPKPKVPDGPLTTASFGLRFGPPPPSPSDAPHPKGIAKPKTPRVRVKNDPQLVAKARELRDRYLEQVNDRLLIAPSGKYDVGRALSETMTRKLPRLAG